VPSRPLLDLPYSTHCGRSPFPLKHGDARNVSVRISGTSAANCTSEILDRDVTSVTAVPTQRAGPKVTGSRTQNDIKGHDGCQKRVKAG